MLEIWEPPNYSEVLLLLGPSGKLPQLRQYAINRLNEVSDEILLLILLPLVQALRYEDFSKLPNFNNIEKNEAINDIKNDNFEISDIFSLDCSKDPQRLLDYDATMNKRASLSEEEINEQDKCEILPKKDELLVEFLIRRSAKNIQLCNYFYWYVAVEWSDLSKNNPYSKSFEIFQTVLNLFRKLLRLNNLYFTINLQAIALQIPLDNALKRVLRKLNKRKKLNVLHAILSDEEYLQYDLSKFPHLTPLLLDPTIICDGIILSETKIFSSSLAPIYITFTTRNKKTYPLIFKSGDDLRQDQLILQIIALIDLLLLQVNLDCKLTPYKVLATDTEHGYVEYIKSMAVADIIQKYGFLFKYDP
ncbi:hypothetical protein A3Q56_03353 [Intoshia linei]|uniref:PI3K/PI4K catalytic domain-containing protein n=1 Tax=Intoshia linei TaxID=1819745 RepID=A0A177B649_9BILA|nr:hypothetical protein A3Q56_03353 [Intoshia linei]